MSHNHVNRPQSLIGSFHFYLKPLSIVFVPKTKEFKGQIIENVMLNRIDFYEFLRRSNISEAMYMDVFRDGPAYTMTGRLKSEWLYHLGIELKPGTMHSMIITYLDKNQV